MRRLRIVPVFVTVSCVLLTQNLGAQMPASHGTLKSKKAKDPECNERGSKGHC
jgi:hypothetical protein